MIVYKGMGAAAAPWLLPLLCGLPFGALFYDITRRFLRMQPVWWARSAVFLIGMVTAFNVIYIADAFNLLFFLLFFAAALWWCTEGSRAARLSMILILYPMAMSFNALVDGLPAFLPEEVSLLVQFVCRAAFWGGLDLFARALVRDTDGRPLLSRNLWLLIDLLALSPAITLLVLVVFPSYDRMGDQVILLFQTAAMLILPVVTASSVGLLYAVVVLSRHEALQRREALWDLRSLYYQNLEQEQLQVRKLRHDMANHLQALSGLLDTPEKARAYLTSLANRPGLTVSRRFCANPVVNTVLTGKLARMEQAGIIADIQVSLPEALPLEDPDLCALFANALDNAIEACERLENPTERVIQVRAKAERGLFLLRVANRTDGRASETLETRKPDKARHGYGIAILREIAGRAGGGCEILQRPGVFELIVTVPLPGGP